MHLPVAAYTGDVDGWITLKEATARYGYGDVRALRYAVERQQIEAEKIGNTWLLKEESVAAYVTGRSQAGRGRPRGPRRRPEGD